MLSVVRCRAVNVENFTCPVDKKIVTELKRYLPCSTCHTHTLHGTVGYGCNRYIAVSSNHIAARACTQSDAKIVENSVIGLFKNWKNMTSFDSPYKELKLNEKVTRIYLAYLSYLTNLNTCNLWNVDQLYSTSLNVCSLNVCHLLSKTR